MLSVVRIQDDGVFFVFFSFDISFFVVCSSVKIRTMMVEGSSEQSRNQFYMYAYIVLLPPLLPLCCVLLLLLLFFFLLRRHRVDTVCVRFHNRVPGPDILFFCTVCPLLHDVRVCMRIYLPTAV